MGPPLICTASFSAFCTGLGCQIPHFHDRIEDGSLIDIASTGLAQPGDRLAMFPKSNGRVGQRTVSDFQITVVIWQEHPYAT